MSRFLAEVHVTGVQKASKLAEKNKATLGTTLVDVQAKTLVDILVEMKADQGGGKITL